MNCPGVALLADQLHLRKLPATLPRGMLLLLNHGAGPNYEDGSSHRPTLYADPIFDGKIFKQEGTVYAANSTFVVQVAPVKAAPKIRGLHRELCGFVVGADSCKLPGRVGILHRCARGGERRPRAHDGAADGCAAAERV